MSNTSAKILGAIGRILIGAGLLTLAFAGFQLWGTSVAEGRAQDNLNAQLEQSLPASTTADTADDKPEAETAPSLTADEGPAGGQPFGRIKIPKIGVEKAIIEGVTRDDLRQAPGHYPDTPLPGQPGNAAIAGHRTTYGQPFHDIDQLIPGDKIEVETFQGSFTYVVEGHPAEEAGADASGEVGHQIVLPGDVEVIEDKGDNRITLTACHPKFSAQQRIIVSAVLEAQPAPATTRPAPTTSVDNGVSFEDSLGWQYDQTGPTALWAFLTACVGAAAWLIGRMWRRVWAYALSAPFLVASLLVCFSHLDKLIPAV